ncbi:hypothetical protein FS749_005176 [Ceratobasidium sp. UAMH 11750]|nr:hypothetical protein FS749_005176 [Ceratobasidium sp. UAMH 11750]
MATSSTISGLRNESNMQSPNVFIFPPSVVDKCRDVAGISRSYAPDELMKMIAENATAVDHVGKIVVTQVYYFKEKSGAEHEFLVFQVEDTIHGFTNYLKVDRCPKPEEALDKPPEHLLDQPPARLGEDLLRARGRAVVSRNSKDSVLIYLSISSSSGLIGTRNARDQVEISGLGTLDSLTSAESVQLGTIMVSTSHELRPTLEHVLLLSAFVSAYEPRYHLFQAQCYWFAYTIWQVLQFSFPDSVKFEGYLPGVGTIMFAPWVEWHLGKHASDYARPQDIPNKAMYAALAAKYILDQGMFEKEIPALQKKYGTKARKHELAEARAAVERAQGETARVQAALEKVQEELRRAKASK